MEISESGNSIARKGHHIIIYESQKFETILMFSNGQWLRKLRGAAIKVENRTLFCGCFYTMGFFLSLKNKPLSHKLKKWCIEHVPHL